MTIQDLNESLAALYKSQIDSKDVTEIATRLDISRFTVYQYFNSNGKSVNTAGDILKCANDIIEERRIQAQRAETLNDYQN